MRKYTLILHGTCWEPVSEQDEALTHVSAWTFEQMLDLYRRLLVIQSVAKDIGLCRAVLDNRYGERFIYSSLLNTEGYLSRELFNGKIVNLPFVLDFHDDSTDTDGKELSLEDFSDLCNSVFGVALLSEQQAAHFTFAGKPNGVFSSNTINVYPIYESDVFSDFSFSIDDMGSPISGETQMISIFEWKRLIDAVNAYESSLICQEYAKAVEDRLFSTP